MAIPSFQDADLERRIEAIRKLRGDATLTGTVRALLREKVVMEEAEIKGLVQTSAINVTSTRGNGS